MRDCHVTEVIQPLWPAETTWSQGGLENGFLEQSFCRSTIASISLMVISISESDSSNMEQAILRITTTVKYIFHVFRRRIVVVHICFIPS